jgi:putative cardiolipin synthase
LFDRFWNSPYAYPMQSLVRSLPRQGNAEGATPIVTASLPSEPSRRVDDADDGGTIGAELDRGAVAQRFARARLLADAPSTIADDDPDRGDSAVMQAHLKLVASAEATVLVATPYFVPGADGLATLREARGRDVRFTVMTNSLASTDEPLVHFGYARYRRDLLKLGVSLHELMPMPDAVAASGDERHGASVGRLHAKLVVVDDRWVSIGSMNMDRRSARANTEAAIVIDDPVLAGEVATFLERGRRSASYALRLSHGSARIEWVGWAGAVVRDEPRPDSGAGLKQRLASFLVPEELL